jgi:hypothetical protein
MIINMPMSKADDAMAELVVDINDKQKVLDAIAHLYKIYPDLKIQRDGRIASFASLKFSTATVNSIVDGIDIEKHYTTLDALHNGHESVEAWPYTTIEGYKVYSDPPCFTIGETYTMGFGTVPLSKWEDAMGDAGIAKVAIKATKDYFKKNPPIPYYTQNTDNT